METERLKGLSKSYISDTTNLLETAAGTTEYENTFVYSAKSNNSTNIKMHKRSIFVVSFTLLGCMMGAQIFTMPYATIEAGLWLSLIINLYNCICGIISCYLLLEAKKMSGENTCAKIGYY